MRDQDNPRFEIEVVPSVQNFLREQKAILNEALDFVGQQLYDVFDYEPENIDIGQFPCITLGEVRFQKTWVAAPYLIEIRYELPISGYILFDDNHRNAQAIRAFLAAVSHVFEDPRNQELPVRNRTYTIHYHSEPPLDSGEIDYTMIGGAFLRSFRATWHGYITRNTHYEEG